MINKINNLSVFLKKQSLYSDYIKNSLDGLKKYSLNEQGYPSDSYTEEEMMDPSLTLDKNPNIDKYFKDGLESIEKIIVEDSISRSQFNKWRDKPSPEGLKDGMRMMTTGDGKHTIKVFLEREDKEFSYGKYAFGESYFSISYPVVNGDIKKTLGEVLITNPIVQSKYRGNGFGSLVYMIVLYIAYKNYGAKYLTTHATEGTGDTSPSAIRVYKSLRDSGVISPVRNVEYHKKYLHGIKNDRRGENIMYSLSDNHNSWNEKDIIDAIDDHQLDGEPMGHYELYEINHNAILRFFKEFVKKHPHLEDSNGNLKIDYNHVRLKLARMN